MEECFKCQIPETKALLFDAVISEGIVKICRKCSFEEDILIIRGTSLSKPEKKITMYERLSRIAGVNMHPEKDPDLEKKNELRKVVESNFVFRENLELKKELIHNFHWIVMRARRMKHLTQEQLAQEINEPEIVIKKIETGFAPERVDTIKKIEKCLEISIMKHSVEEDFLENLTTEFNIKSFDDLTIDDLHEMRKKREGEILRDE